MNTEKTTHEENENLNRDSLIVPDEIFADSEEPLTEEREEIPEEPVESTEHKTDNTVDEDVQMSFFEEERTLPESDENKTESDTEKNEESKIIKFEQKDEAGYDPKSPRLIDKIFDFVELFALTVAAVFVLTTLLFKHAIVDGPSMDTTLTHGEHLIISDLFYEPERGDIVVFEDFSLGDNLKKPIVKRVIAVGGDTVRIDIFGNVYVNGEKTDESEYKYLSDGTYKIYSSHRYARLEEYKVPEGCIFVLGDNRNNSTDSRTFGAISTDTVLGEVKLRIFPFDGFGAVD